MTDSAPHHIEPVSRTHVSQGLKLNYLDWGSEGAPLLLLVHGSQDHARSWDWVARALSPEWRVIAPDLRGHGDSDWSADGAYLSSYHLLDLADLIDALGADQLSIVGHSFGGNISARYTAAFPDRVRRLALVDGIGPSPSVFEDWARTGSVVRSRDWIERRRAAGARAPRRFATVEEAVARFAGANAHLTAEQAAHLARHGLRRFDDGYSWKSDPLAGVFPPEDFTAETPAVWEAIACPTLLFWGAKSWTTNPATDGRGARFQDQRTVVYEDAGHWLHHEKLDDFVAELSGFL
jgi:pimeloyl-ACP methyl ester carboxylesterase